MDWELIQLDATKTTRTDRLKVFGGWKVITRTVVETQTSGSHLADIKVTSIFVADPRHKWKVEPVNAMVLPTAEPKKRRIKKVIEKVKATRTRKKK